MSTIDNLIRQWCEQIVRLEQADQEKNAAKKAGDREREAAADQMIRGALEALEATDNRIADSVPESMRDATLLAAFAYRGHTQAGWIIENGRMTGEMQFEAALEKVLATLVHYLVQISDSDISEIADHWCVPLDGKSNATRPNKDEMIAAHEAWIRALYMQQATARPC